MHHTILAPLSHRRQAQVARALALVLLPLLLGLGYMYEGLTDPLPPVAGVRVLRRVRRRTWCRPTRATRVWPIARQLLRPVLVQTGLLALLLGATPAARPLLLLASLPLLRALLTLIALVWPR